MKKNNIATGIDIQSVILEFIHLLLQKYLKIDEFLIKPLMVGIRTCGHPVENLKMRRRWWRYYGLRNLLDFEETIFQFPVVLEMHMNHMAW
jgi:hypothetical protein